MSEECSHPTVGGWVSIASYYPFLTVEDDEHWAKSQD